MRWSTLETTDDIGVAELRRLDDGRTVVARAGDVIGVDLELLAAPGTALPVDADGMLLLAGDPAYRYRPVRFQAFYAGCVPRVLVFERIRD